MQKNNQPASQEKFKTLIGGQALIEGILMQGPDKRAIVVRGPEGLVQKVEPIKKKTGLLTLPFIRGVVNFGSSMVNGVKALMYSADFFPEEASEPSKFENGWNRKSAPRKSKRLWSISRLCWALRYRSGFSFCFRRCSPALFRG